MTMGNGTPLGVASENGTALLIDRHDLTRYSLTTLLSRGLDGLEVAAVGSIEDAAKYASAPVKAVILKLDDEEKDLAGALSRIRKHGGALDTAPVMMVVHAHTFGRVTEALGMGVRACVGPAVSATDLAMAVRLIINGAVFIGPGVLLHGEPVTDELCAKAPADGPQEAHAAVSCIALTHREQEVLTHLREGKPNKIIAHELGISESTVKVHVSRILRKLRATNRTEAACANQDVGFIDDDAAGCIPPPSAPLPPSLQTY